MNGFERLTNIFNLRPTDRLSLTIIADDATRSVMPDKLREMPLLDFYRYIGCDILQFGNYGLPDNVQVKYPYKLITPEILIEEHVGTDGLKVVKQKTSWGELTSAYKQAHPIKYPVASIEDIRILKNIWLNSHYEEIDDGVYETYEANRKEIGEDGIFVPTLDASPVQHLLEYEMGAENFYYLLEDYEEDVEELLSIMHTCRMQEYRILAGKMPGEAVIPVENTSSGLISPQVYRKYSLPQIRDFVGVMREHGKKAAIHMCGHIKNLLNDIKETGLDGIHALTPPTIGDTEFEYALDVLGDKLIIIGCLDSTVFQRKDVSSGEIRECLERTITPRLREANFILWAVADGLPTPVEKFLIVGEWIEKNGTK